MNWKNLNLNDIKNMTSTIDKAVAELLQKEISNFYKTSTLNTPEERNKLLDIIEPILLSALSVVLAMFARLLYKQEDILKLCEILYKQNYDIELARPVPSINSQNPFDTIQKDEEPIVAKEEIKYITNMKPNKDLN